MKRNSALLSALVFAMLGCASAQSASKSAQFEGGADRELASGSVGDRVSRRYAEIADLLAQVRNGTASGEDVCTADAYQGSILEALQKAKEYAGNVGEFTKRVSPAVQQALQSVLGFKSLMADLDLSLTPDFLNKNLPGSHWEDVGHGAYGHATELNFHDGDKVTVRFHRWLDENADGPTWISYEGSWKISYHKRDTGKFSPHLVITYVGAKGKTKTVAYEIEASYREGFGYKLLSGGKKAEGGEFGQRHIEYYDHKVDECDA